jgi:hypothetical protein
MRSGDAPRKSGDAGLAVSEYRRSHSRQCRSQIRRRSHGRRGERMAGLARIRVRPLKPDEIRRLRDRVAFFEAPIARSRH